MRRAGAAVVDQAIWSLGTFATSALVGRYLGVDAFGQFSVAVVAIFAVGSVVNSLVIDPAMVIGPRDFPDLLKNYGTVIVLETAAIGSVAAALGGLVILVGGSELTYVVGIGLIVALPTMISWAARRLPYMDERPALAALGSTVYLAASIGGLAAANALGVLSVVTALLILAGAASLQAAAMAVIWRPSWGSVRETMNRRVWRSQWEYGRWLIGSEFSAWIVNYGLVGFTAGAISLNAAGGFRASQVLQRPFGIAFQGVRAAEIPHATRLLAEKGLESLSSMVRRTTFALVAFCMAGSIGMLFAGDVVMALLFGPEFRSFGGLAAAMTGSTVLVALSVGPGIALHAAGFPGDTFWANLWSGVVGLLFGLVLGVWLGVEGLVVTMWLAAATRGLVMIGLWRRRLRDPEGSARASIGPSAAAAREDGQGRDG